MIGSMSLRMTLGGMGQPGFGRAPGGAVGGLQPFTLTAGAFMIYPGYITTAIGVPAQVGSISNEPVTGFTLLAMYDAGGEGIQFIVEGNAEAALADVEMWIDGEAMTRSSGPTFNAGTNQTTTRFASETFNLEEHGIYEVVFVEPFKFSDFAAISPYYAEYDLRDLSTLFTDIAGTVNVANDGDRIARIHDKSGNGWHLVAPNDTARLTYKVQQGIPRAVSAGSQGLRTTAALPASINPVKVPVFIVAGISTGAQSPQPIFGVVGDNNNRIVIQNHNGQDRNDGYIRSTELGLVQVTGTFSLGPLAAPCSCDVLAVAGQIAVRTNSIGEVTAATAWTSSSATNNTPRIALGYAGGSLHATPYEFFSGSVLFANPAALRDPASELCRKLSRVKRRADDINLLACGDSTGDAIQVEVGDGNGEWVWRLARYIASQDPTAFVGIRLYLDSVKGYAPEVIVQNGTGGPRYRIWNCSVPGKVPQYVVDNWETAIEGIPVPRYVWWNFGHNIAAMGVPIETYPSHFTVAMDPVRALFPDAQHFMIRQNPNRVSNNMQAINEQGVDVVAAGYGDVVTVDVYQEWYDYDPPRSPDLYASGGVDTVHPSIPLGVTVSMPPIEAAWDARAV